MLVFITTVGCSSLVKEESGQLVIDPRLNEAVSAAEKVAITAGIPLANYMSEIFGVGCGIALYFVDKNRRRERLAVETLVRGIEKSKSQLVKKEVAHLASSNGSYDKIDKTIRKVT